MRASTIFMLSAYRNECLLSSPQHLIGELRAATQVQVVIKLQHHRLPRRQLRHRRRRAPMPHQRQQSPQAGIMRHNQQEPPMAQHGRHRLLPATPQTRRHIGKGLRRRQLPGLQRHIARVGIAAACVPGRQRRGRLVVAPLPALQLLCAERFSRLSPIHPLQHTLVPSIEAPVLQQRNPRQSHLAQNDGRRLNRPGKHRGKRHAKLRPRIAQQSPGEHRLAATALRQRDIRPPAQAILLIPKRGSMPQQNQGLHAA